MPKEREVRDCRYCGASFRPLRRRNAKYCGKTCANKARLAERLCEACAVIVGVSPGRKYDR